MNAMSDSPILVISDMHLGFEDESADRFQNFITRCLTSWVHRGQTTIERTGETLDAPRKIILLGDFIDLWVSRDDNTVRPYKESFGVVNSLNALNREIVYVAGNHDCIAGTFYAKKNSLPDWGYVFHRYPEPPVDGRWKGEKIGEMTYFFLHGHQFDVFRYKSVLRLSNFVGSAAAAAEGFWKFKWLGALVFLCTLGVVASALFPNPLFTVLSGLTASLNTWLGAGLMLIIGVVLGLLVSLGVLWLFGRFFWVYYDLYRHPGHTPKNRFNLKMPLETLQQVIKSTGFKREQQRIDANVIVFGHTHNPGMCRFQSGPNKFLVNSGSWILQSGNEDDPHTDTFVYIDDSGPRLLKWHDKRCCVSQLISWTDCDKC
jgi:UDP-2,3-diacylglucosamine pyrophosphatase LpxH